MSYIKKVLVLSQVIDGFSLVGKRVSGIARIETIEGVSTFYLSTVNFATVNSGGYFAYILTDNKKVFSFDLGLKPSSITKTLDASINIDKGFAVGISFIKDDVPVLVAFAKGESFNVNISDFKKIVIEKIISEKKKERSIPKSPPPAIPLPSPEREAPDTQLPLDIPNKVNYKYDDEAVATENYYDKDLDFTEKLKIIENLDGAYVRIKNGVSDIRSKAQAQEDQSLFNGVPYEKDDISCPKYSKTNPYYDYKKKELEDIFLKFPEEERLKNNLLDSKWAKITYAENKYYVVGVIKEDGKEKYICYGVPAKYSDSPPKELKGFCSFIPLSVFDMKGDGYFMMFQDAITGECIKRKQV